MVRTILIPLLLVCALLTPGVAAQTPVASPVATRADLPEGPLGEQIAWLMETLNGDPEAITPDVMEQHFGPAFLQAVSAETIASTLVEFNREGAPFTIEPGSLEVTGEDSQPTATYIMAAVDGTRLTVIIGIVPPGNLIEGLVFQPAPEAPAAQASPVAGISDEPVSFDSHGITIHGSLMTPDDLAQPGPGALIISGSGPTDRNGNSVGLDDLDTNLNLALTLADQGVTSLRYDKLGSGETGLAGISDPAAITASLFLEEASDAATFLASQPTVDPQRLILVGHSEGALFALKLAEDLTAAGSPPAALILVAPLSIRYLDLLQEQLTVQYDAAETGGLMSAADAEAGRAEVADIIDSLRTTGELPDDISPQLATIFSAGNLAFLVEADSWDPAVMAATLPSTLPVLVLQGEKDQQVTVPQVEQLMAGFAEAGNTDATLVTLPDANHLLKDVPGTPNPALDYIDPSLPFSPAAVSAIAAFLAAHDFAG